MTWLCWTKKKQCGSGRVEPEGEQSRRERMLGSEQLWMSSGGLVHRGSDGLMLIGSAPS
jgi:hypothetical protein